MCVYIFFMSFYVVQNFCGVEWHNFFQQVHGSNRLKILQNFHQTFHNVILPDFLLQCMVILGLLSHFIMFFTRFLIVTSPTIFCHFVYYFFTVREEEMQRKVTLHKFANKFYIYVSQRTIITALALYSIKMPASAVLCCSSLLLCRGAL